jgi:hypothetical protein
VTAGHAPDGPDPRKGSKLAGNKPARGTGAQRLSASNGNVAVTAGDLLERVAF